MPTLIVIGPKLAVREYEVKGALSIGRHESNAVQLTEEKASRMHCSLRLERGQAVVEDLNSANGVYVNGLRVSSQILKHNDRISIGETTLIFCNDESPAKLKDTKVLVDAISSDVNAIIPDSFLAEMSNRSNRPAKNESANHVERDAARAELVATKILRSKRKALRGSGESYSGVIVLGAIALVVLGFVVWQAQPAPKPAPTTPKPFPVTVVEPPREKEKAPVADASLPKREPERVDVAPAEKAKERPNLSLEDQLKEALAARDRALGNGNLLGAKAALQSFLVSVPIAQANDESARRAQRELDDTTKIANAALDMSLDHARQALKAHRFHLVSQRCTSLISNDPNGPYGMKARAMLEQIDELTAQVAATAKSKALDAIANGNLGQARSAVEAVMGELNGTRWAGDLDTLQFQLIVATGFLDTIEAERAKRAKAGESIPLTFAAKKISGFLIGVNGLQARIRVGTGQIEMPISLKILETQEFIAMLDTLELSDRYAELACLWSILGRKDIARKASEMALKKPGDFPIAATLAGLLSNSKNLHLYDFKGWRQQLDWEAVSGSWFSEDGKYVLETTDGGETALKSSAIGGDFPLQSARVGFEFEIRKPSPGWIFSCELGSEKQSVVITFSATEAILQDKSNARNSPIKWTPALTRVEFSIDGDAVAFFLDGKPAATLSIPGISQQKGSIRFRAQQCACAIDNVILRSQE